MKNAVEEAFLSLCLEKHGDTEITWNGNADNYDSLNKVKRTDGETLKFTWDEVLIKKTELVTEYDAQEYARSRKVEYDLLNQFELMTDDAINDTTTHLDAINAIKAKYPKP